MRTVVTASVSHRCPFVAEVDIGSVTIEFAGPAPELHALRRFLDGFHDQALTHEQVAEAIANAYPEAAVTAEFTTAGLLVRCYAP